MSDTFFAQHPDPGKHGVNISKEKYDQVHDVIVAALVQQDTMTLKELTQAAKSELAGVFEGSIGWYVTVVKLDMESRGEILCDRSKSPHLIQLS